MSCDGHPHHSYEPGDCAYCGHPRSEHPGDEWDNRFVVVERDDDGEPLAESLRFLNSQGDDLFTYPLKPRLRR